MDTLEESTYIYRNHRSCRVCKTSMVLRDGHSPNFGNYYLCKRCTPKTREQAWELSAQFAEFERKAEADGLLLRKRILERQERYRKLNQGRTY